MFFKTSDISFEILTILKLSWDMRNDKSGIRTHHALSYRIDGSTEFLHENDRIKANSGEIAFIPSFYEYKQISSYEKLIVIHFASDSVLPDKLKIFKPENPSYYEKLFTDLYRIWTKKQTGYKHECKSIIYKIMTKIEREDSQIRLQSTYDKINEAVDYIHDNFTDNSLSIAFLADMSNMSETYFRKLFKKLFSCSPVQYIKKLKLNYAKELLKSSYYTVEDVSAKCGFMTVNYFSTFIKNETGHSPSYFKCN